MNQALIKRLNELYEEIYTNHPHKDFSRFLKMIELNYEFRPNHLKKRDKREQYWYLSEKMVGMTLYIDLFANNIKDMISKVPYLKKLGITFLHLMPVLKPRQGNNDGGYAVEDYRDINPELGTLNDFKLLVSTLHKANINVAIDFVINHTAKEHEWAKKAQQGDSFYQDLYMMYDDERIPNQFNQTVPEVLPDIYPGNFTYYEEFKKYVFKSFSEFQWDLNFRNPHVIEELVSIFLFLSNLGVDIIRLDAIPFIWKELGTQCRNLPRAHDFMEVFQIVKQLACPGVAILGEAIVQPDEIFKYFGSHEHKECDLMYNANMMVNIWNSLATRDTRLLQIDNERFMLPQHGGWINYVRCHDDIGWGLNEHALLQFGMDPASHKQFLISFYNGSHQGSFARGQNYQYNELTRDARTNGTLASLAGLEKAIANHDLNGIDESIKRINLINSFLFSMPGIPLIYSGDEIGLLNNYQHKEDSTKTDGRWIHRIKFPWEQKKIYEDRFTPQGKIFKHTKDLITMRKENSIFLSQIPSKIIPTSNKGVYVSVKTNGFDQLVCIYNFTENHQYINTHELLAYGISRPLKDMFQNKIVSFDEEVVDIYPYEYLWLSNKNSA